MGLGEWLLANEARLVRKSRRSWFTRLWVRAAVAIAAASAEHDEKRAKKSGDR